MFNPLGLHGHEVRASNLVGVDVHGQVIGHRDGPVCEVQLATLSMGRPRGASPSRCSKAACATR